MTRRAHVPNATLRVRDVALALAHPQDLATAERELARRLQVPHVVAFASARGALAAAVAALAPGGCQTAIPGFTCIAVANAVKSAGSSVIVEDVDSRGLLAPATLSDAPLVIVQDTFGFVAEIPAGRMTIRDAAHRADLVTRAGASINVTSFEQSKWVSTGQGGIAVTWDEQLASRLRDWREGQSDPAPRLVHGGVTLLTVLLGRAEFRGRRRLARWLRRVIVRLERDRLSGQSLRERAGDGVDDELLAAPNAVVLRLMEGQVERFDEIRRHRAEIVSAYDQAAGVSRDPQPLVRYPMHVDDPDAFERALARHGWDVGGRWFKTPLHPVVGAAAYTDGAAPTGERLAATVVNLPTHPLVSVRLAERLASLALAAGARPLE